VFLYKDLILLSPPVRISGRDIYPLVRISHQIHASGGWISTEPVALIIDEEGVWSFVSLEEGISEEVILSSHLLR
jgi:hypothetical protein